MACSNQEKVSNSVQTREALERARLATEEQLLRQKENFEVCHSGLPSFLPYLRITPVSVPLLLLRSQEVKLGLHRKVSELEEEVEVQRREVLESCDETLRKQQDEQVALSTHERPLQRHSPRKCCSSHWCSKAMLHLCPPCRHSRSESCRLLWRRPGRT